MVQPIKTVSFLKSGADAARERIKPFLPDNDAHKVNKVDSIEIDYNGELNTQEVKLVQSKENPERYILRFGSTKGREFINGLLEDEKLKDKGVDLSVEEEKEQKLGTSTAYVVEATERFLGFSEDEQKVYNLLSNVSDIVGRVFDRRTSSCAWVLLFLLKRLGFEEDEKGSIPQKIENILKDPNLVKTFVEYLKLRKSDKSKADGYLQNAFEGDSERQKKLDLIKLSTRIIGVCSSLPGWIVNILPVAFTLQNILMPWLAGKPGEGEKGFFRKFANFMVIVNPWISDYFVELLANLMKEVKGIRSTSSTLFANVQIKLPKSEENGNKLIVDKVKLTEFNHEEYGLQRIVKEVNDAFDRIFGKYTTISSLVLNGILWLFAGKDKNYQKFAAQFVDNPSYIKKLCEHLKKGENAKLEETFKGMPGGQIVSRVILGVVKGVRSVSEDTIKRVTNTFGLIYSIQNLLVPILAHIFKGGILGWVIRFLRKLNPPINDLLVDHLANFRKEILKILRERMIELFPRLDIKTGFAGMVENFKSVLAAIRSFVPFGKGGFQPGTS